MSNDKQSRLTFWQTFRSVIASLLGVQSRHNAQRDFERGNPLAFIAVGLLVGLGFVLTVFLVVRLVLHSYGL